MRQQTLMPMAALLGLALIPWPAAASRVQPPERLQAAAVPPLEDPEYPQGADTRTISVLPAPPPGELIVNGGFEFGTAGWRTRDVAIGAEAGTMEPHTGAAAAWFSGWQNGTPETLRQTVAIPAAAASARLSYWLHIETYGDAPGAVDSFTVKARAEGGPLAILDTRSNLDGAPGYQRRSIDLGAYRGRTVELSFVAHDSPLGVNTAFTLDDVSLVAQ